MEAQPPASRSSEDASIAPSTLSPTTADPPPSPRRLRTARGGRGARRAGAAGPPDAAGRAVTAGGLEGAAGSSGGEGRGQGAGAAHARARLPTLTGVAPPASLGKDVRGRGLAGGGRATVEPPATRRQANSPCRRHVRGVRGCPRRARIPVDVLASIEPPVADPFPAPAPPVVLPVRQAPPQASPVRVVGPPPAPAPPFVAALGEPPPRREGRAATVALLVGPLVFADGAHRVVARRAVAVAARRCRPLAAGARRRSPRPPRPSLPAELPTATAPVAPPRPPSRPPRRPTSRRPSPGRQRRPRRRSDTCSDRDRAGDASPGLRGTSRGRRRRRTPQRRSSARRTSTSTSPRGSDRCARVSSSSRPCAAVAVLSATPARADGGCCRPNPWRPPCSASKRSRASPAARN